MTVNDIINANETFFVFETSRSSGKGGQHVNKTETRVTLVWDLQHANLDEDTKEKLQTIQHHYVQYPILRISSQKTRSQLKNKEDVLRKLSSFLEENLKEEKERKKTKIPKVVKEKRLKQKKKKGDIKSTRKKIDPRDL